MQITLYQIGLCLTAMSSFLLGIGVALYIGVRVSKGNPRQQVPIQLDPAAVAEVVTEKMRLDLIERQAERIKS